MSFRSGNELEFAKDKKPGQASRVVGNTVNKIYETPEGWKDTGGGTLEDIAPKGSALIVLQPDTALDLSPSTCPVHTYVRSFKKTEELLESIVTQTPEALQEIMGLGKKMAASHLDRFKTFEKLPPKQACLMFGGKSLRADDWNYKEQKYAEEHIRLLTGLYGLLRPYDDVKPVRDVPIGAKLETKSGPYLLDFWSVAINKQIHKDLEEIAKKRKGKLLVVGALSDEYWKAIKIPGMPKNVDCCQVVFEGANDEETRRARSLYGRYCVRKMVEDPDGARGFDHDDWNIDARKSMPTRLIFKWDGDDKGKAKEKKKDKEKEKAKKKKRTASESSVGSAQSDANFKVGVIEDDSCDSDAPQKSKSKKPDSKKERGGRERARDAGSDSEPPRPKKGNDRAGSDSDAPPEKAKKGREGRERGGGRSRSPPRDSGKRDSGRRREAPARDDSRGRSPPHRAPRYGRASTTEVRDPSPPPRARKNRDRSRS